MTTKTLPFKEKFNNEVAGRCKYDLAGHNHITRLNEGMFRQWRCQKPGTWVYGFDITTWPGYLAITGDMGSFVWMRENDMLPWFASAVYSLGYVSEKLQCGDLRKFYPELVEEWLEVDLKQSYDNDIPEWFDGEYKTIREAWKWHNDPRLLMQSIYESKFYDGEMPDFKYYTFNYLWCLDAIAWLLQRLGYKVSS